MDQLLFNFGKIAKFLKHPLVLLGFVIMLVFSVYDKTLEKGIIPTLSTDQGRVIVHLMLGYGFQLGVFVVILGFTWQFYKTRTNWLLVLIVLSGFGLLFYQSFVEKEVNISSKTAETTASIQQIVATLTKQHQPELQAKDEQLKAALTVAVNAVKTGQGIGANESERNAALAAMAQGNTTLAKTLFAKATHKGEQDALQTAESYRNLGVLAFLDNTQEALQSYRRATQLDPDNTDGWIRLGYLLIRVGDLTEAIAVYNTVSTLGEKHGLKQEIAAAYENSGNVYQTLGDLDKAIEFQQKSLKLYEDLGRVEGMALNYGNLGNVYLTRGDLDKAIEFQQKALKLDEDLGNKEGMAIDYGNLGNVYKLQGNKTEAKRYYLMSIELFKQLGSPNVKAVQTLLGALQ
jgi:tetratricopeptide (TPR) repeat protein